MRKDIKELTNKEGEEIFNIVYPKDKNPHHSYTCVGHERIYREDGHEKITFGFRSCIGIFGHNGQDNIIIPFNDTKVVLWLYNNGYEIGELLEENKFNTEVLDNACKMHSSIHRLHWLKDVIKPEYKDKFTLEYVLDELKRIDQKWWDDWPE